ncbi:MAG: hypothetical protein MH472_14635, partial [Bacteroidia bacterium]|nr:hypothetical protein [Bacteroidia bacterium]
RVFSANEYRFGFNGQEKDDEVSGDGNTMTAEFWEYDARLGRRWNLDPIIYDWQSGYACINNNPIYFTDPNGDEPTPDGKQIDNNKSPTPWKVGREHSSLSLPLKEVVITAFKTTPLSSQNQVTVNTDIKCHPGNDFQANELARIQKEYAKLNYSSGQVDLPRNSAWDFLFGKRTYVGGYEVNSKGYLTGKMTPQTGSPDLIGGMGLLKVPSQLANFNRFAKSLPNTATNFSIFDMPNGGKAFQAYVPATNIPGSFAIYEKQIDAAGKTLQMTKTTIDAEGKVVHIRDLLMHQKVYIKP